MNRPDLVYAVCHLIGLRPLKGGDEAVQMRAVADRADVAVGVGVPQVASFLSKVTNAAHTEVTRVMRRWRA